MNIRRLLNSGPAFLVTIVVLGVVGTAVGAKLADSDVTPEDLAQSSVQGCEGQNELRDLMRRRILGDVVERLEQMAQTVTTDPALFPDIPPDRFAQELSENVEIDGNRIAFFAAQISLTDPADCVARYLG